MIKVTNLVKDYGSTRALNEVSLIANTGEILGLLGPNGAGKTTLMRIITGFLKQTGGQVLIDDLNINYYPQAIQSKIGYLPENTPLTPELNVYEQLEFAAMAQGIGSVTKDQAIARMVELCGLKEYLYFGIAELSKGYRQRVGLAQALIHDPEILILDEPTTGLDPNQIAEIRGLIKSLGKKKTVILSTHIMQEVEALCDRVTVINKGVVVADDTPDRIKLNQNQGNVHFKYNLLVKGSSAKIVKLLEQIVGVTHVSRKETGEESVSQYTVVATQDVRAQINKEIIKADFDLLEMNVEKGSMERAFQKLTQNK
jgi:ABC-2 type transport system ATP-binding protein